MLTVELFVSSLSLLLIPGTGVMHTLSTGLFGGGPAGIGIAAGCTAGIVAHHFAGCCYLFYLAWSMWRQHGALAFSRPAGERNLAKGICRGFLINSINPMLSLLFLDYLPLCISPESGLPTLQRVTLAGVFMAMTCGVFVLNGLLANTVRRYLVNGPERPRYLQRSFILLGLKLAIR